MGFAFNHIGLVGVHQNPAVEQTVLHMVSYLRSLDIKVVVETNTHNSLQEKSSGVTVKSLDGLGKCCDLVIAIGGDGNMLAAARVLSLANVPLVGINRGKLGFLTDITPEALEKELLSILQGEYEQTTRFLIEGKIKHADGQTTDHGNALNDIVLFPGKILQSIEFELYINDQFVYSQQSDGLIIATPTGSTAYSLSAGGPIMYPNLNTLLLVPMYPHALTNRPIVVDANNEIKLFIGDRNKINPRLSFDGQDHFSLSMGDTVTINQQAKTLKLIHPKGYNYYDVLRYKLHWGTPLINTDKPFKGHE